MSKALQSLSRCFPPVDSDARLRSLQIDAMLKRDKRESVTILVYGEHHSGKSTLLKQMRLINGEEFNHKERLQYREAIYENIIQGMKVLVQERNKLDIPLQNSANEMHEILFTSFDWCMRLEPCTFQPYVGAVDSLWKDSAIGEAYRKRSDLEWYEPVKYYFDNIHRIGELNYLPHNQDILHAHKSRTTIGELYFVLRDSPFMLVDFSNTFRSRNILRPCLWDTHCPILYIIASNNYDQYDLEDNCLVESLRVFERLLLNRMFLHSPFFIFFNKMDLLAEKVQTADIRKHFPEFQGDPHRLEDVQEFLVRCFEERKQMINEKLERNDSRPVFYHMTTAVDTENIRTVFNSVKDTIMGRNLQKIPLL